MKRFLVIVTETRVWETDVEGETEAEALAVAKHQASLRSPDRIEGGKIRLCSPMPTLSQMRSDQPGGEL